MALTPKELTWAGLAKEATFGTAVAPTYTVPNKDVKPEDKISYVKDQGIRGAMAETYNIIPGVSQSDFQIDGEVFPDSFGLFALALLGSDTVTGAAAPYTHSFKLARTSQPPSLTTTWYDGTSVRQYAGQMGEELQLKWSKGGALEYTFKSQGMPSKTATGITPSPSSTVPFVGWEFACTLASQSNMNLTGFDITLKRKLYVQHPANNSQEPNAIISLGLEVTGKATFDKVDDTELSDFLNNTQPSLVLTGTQASSGDVLTIQMTKCAFIKDPITAKEVVQGDVEFEGVDNTTDGGPILISLQNAVASY